MLAEVSRPAVPNFRWNQTCNVLFLTWSFRFSLCSYAVHEVKTRTLATCVHIQGISPKNGLMLDQLILHSVVQMPIFGSINPVLLYVPCWPSAHRWKTVFITWSMKQRLIWEYLHTTERHFLHCALRLGNLDKAWMLDRCDSWWRNKTLYIYPWSNSNNTDIKTVHYNKNSTSKRKPVKGTEKIGMLAPTFRTHQLQVGFSNAVTIVNLLEIHFLVR